MNSIHLLTDLLADVFTADDLHFLATKLGFDLAQLAGERREETAANIVQWATDQQKLGKLLLHMRQRHPRYVPEHWKMSNDGRTLLVRSGIDLAGIEPTEDELNNQAGTLSASGSARPHVPHAERKINTGFANIYDAANPSDKDLPLATERDYYFWLEIGAAVKGAIDTKKVQLDVTNLSAGAIFQVVLFGFPDGLILPEEPAIGELILKESGAIGVQTAVASPAVGQDLLGRRLFFPITTPASDGEYLLRCNIYYQQILLQSHLVTAHVAEDPEPRKDALSTTADFIISHSLNVAERQPHSFSVLLNDNGNGTHGFRFFGEGNLANDVTLDAGELQDMIDQARGALRMAAWGSEAEYTNEEYRYADGPDIGRLKTDLFRCAIRGYRFYDVFINRMAGGGRKSREWRQTMRQAGTIQFASKQSARLVLPTAMIYDYPLDTGLNASQFKLCPTFEKALKEKTPLAQTACFQGNCPSAGQDDTICPSGFWGYRHAIGMPVTIPHAADAPTTLKATGGVELAMAVSTDPAFAGRTEHEQALKKLLPDLKFHYAAERPETIKMMQERSPHVLYFFCHGRLANGVPSIEVGPPKTRGISRDNLRNDDIFWEETRPLIFINGCHTTALEPKSAIDLVSGFLDTAEAAGVIGTEITNFVPVARIFAEECLRQFLVERQPIGQAIRLARLAVLQQANPLGLMYVPYVMADLRIER